MLGHKRKNVSIWYTGAVVAITAGLLLKSSLTQAQDSDKKLFELVNASSAQTLDIEQLEGEKYGGFGTATIELDLAPDGRITNAIVNTDAVRRGREEFVHYVRDVMRTWEYTPDVSGSFYVTVAVPSANERQAGKLANISVDLTNLRLSEDVTISLARKDASRVVAQKGFLDQVTVTGAPPKVQELYKDNIGHALGSVFGNLGPFFQVLFVITALAWVCCLYLAVKQVL
ncbi:hypothetical protein MJD09_04765, partial [bacterium]|nr:hypothetical protein [bacterium]